MAGDLNVPFEEQDTTPLDLSDAQLSGGVVVMGAFLPAPDGGTLPCLVFRYARPDGSGFWPPIGLAGDNVAHLTALPGRVTDAVRAAGSRAKAG